MVTLEAMKMEHSVVAPRDGVVVAVMVAQGMQVAQGQVMVQLEGAKGEKGPANVVAQAERRKEG